MPVILSPEQFTAWLDPDNRDTAALATWLVGCGDDVLTMHPVSTDVNNARNNRPDLVDPIDPASTTLFS
jgi:putative SOS response-associated peptidase YedK